jgi:hypothetical protein
VERVRADPEERGERDQKESWTDEASIFIGVRPACTTLAPKDKQPALTGGPLASSSPQYRVPRTVPSPSLTWTEELRWSPAQDSPALRVVPHHLRWCPWGCTLSCCRGLLDLSSGRQLPNARNEVSTDIHHVNATRLVDEKSHDPDIQLEPGFRSLSACHAPQASDHRDVSRKPILVIRVSRDPSSCSSWSRKPWWSCWRPDSRSITRSPLLVFSDVLALPVTSPAGPCP